MPLAYNLDVDHWEWDLVGPQSGVIGELCLEIGRDLTASVDGRYASQRVAAYLSGQVKERIQQILRQKQEDIQTLSLPGFFPVSTNKLMESTHFERKRLKDDDLAVVCAAILDQGLVKVNQESPVRRRVEITMYTGEVGKRKRGRRMDNDNACKSLYDALKRSGLIYEDGDKWCKQEMPVLVEGAFPEVGGHGTFVTIENLV